MAYHGIGIVSYVDFTPINKRPGFGEDVDSVVKSAFVHFSDPYYAEIGGSYGYHFRYRTTNRNTDFWDKINSDQSYKLQLESREYWICLKNKKPVQRTLMNIHQVVENGRYLENLITEQGEEIKNLKETIEKQREIISGLHNAVYQLLGGLYCQRTQGGILNAQLETIGFGSDGYNEDDTHPSGIWPTTRQGDQHEKRLGKIEDFLTHNLHTAVRFSEHNIEEDDSSQQDSDLYDRKHCADCGKELTQEDLEFYQTDEEERDREEQERMTQEDLYYRLNSRIYEPR